MARETHQKTADIGLSWLDGIAADALIEKVRVQAKKQRYDKAWELLDPIKKLIKESGGDPKLMDAWDYVEGGVQTAFDIDRGSSWEDEPDPDPKGATRYIPSILKGLDRLERDIKSYNQNLLGRYAKALHEVQNLLKKKDWYQARSVARNINRELSRKKVFKPLSVLSEDLEQDLQDLPHSDKLPRALKLIKKLLAIFKAGYPSTEGAKMLKRGSRRASPIRVEMKTSKNGLTPILAAAAANGISQGHPFVGKTAASPTPPYSNRPTKLIEQKGKFALWQVKHGSKTQWMITDLKGEMMTPYETGFTKKRDAVSAWSKTAAKAPSEAQVNFVKVLFDKLVKKKWMDAKDALSEKEIRKLNEKAIGGLISELKKIRDEKNVWKALPYLKAGVPPRWKKKGSSGQYDAWSESLAQMLELEKQGKQAMNKQAMNKQAKIASLEDRIAKLQSKVGGLKNKRIFFDFRGDKFLMDFRADTGSHKAGAKWLLKAYEDFSKQVLKYSKLNLELMAEQSKYWASASETALQGKPIELAIEAYQGTLGFIATLMFTIDAAVIKRNFHIPAGQPKMWEPMKPDQIKNKLAVWFEKEGWKVTIK